MKKTRRVSKRSRYRSTTKLQPVELATLVEASAAPAAIDRMTRPDAETVEMVPLVAVELAQGSGEIPPPIVVARGPRRSRTRMSKLDR